MREVINGFILPDKLTTARRDRYLDYLGRTLDFTYHPDGSITVEDREDENMGRIAKEFFYPIDYDLQKTLESGQAFRVTKMTAKVPEPTTKFIVCDGFKRCEVSQDILDLPSKPVCLEAPESDIPYWTNYFGLGFDRNKEMEDILRLESYIVQEPFLLDVYRHSKGLRLLNQDPFQTLISFIISQQKSIPAIKTALHKICMEFGLTNWDWRYTEFPLPELLAEATEQELLDCGLGYRAKYVSKTSQMVADGFDLEGLKSTHCDAKTAFDTLQSLPGVGKKVANCVMLFSLGHRNIFPVDVWVGRALKLWGKTEQEVLDKYGDLSGLIQQHIFYAMITTKGKL